MRRAPEVRLLRGERARLTALADSDATPPRLARRARLVLRAAEGRSDRDIAVELGTDAGTVARWRRRFLMQRVPGIERDAPRAGRPPSIPTSTIQVIVRSTLGRRPPGGGFWSARTLAREVGVSKTTVQRVWKSHGIEPHRPAETFRPNPGMRFVNKVTDFVGLYLDPPERAMVFTVDERARTSTLGAKERRAIAAYEDRRRGLEFRAFLQAVDRETPKGLDLHLLVDSRLTPADPEVRRWLARHPRFYLHFVPSGSGSANVIERWFAQFTRKRVGGAAFPSVARLHRAIRDHLALPDAGARPFVWTATAEEIRERAVRAGPARSPATTARARTT
ncbi:MAG TPA: helix-turn-helix domain-containing protein [Thermoplasmata archaeon]|nr:helix-turn-helix domain-containing protein [Thermoplasmata archaeon]